MSIRIFLFLTIKLLLYLTAAAMQHGSRAAAAIIAIKKKIITEFPLKNHR